MRTDRMVFIDGKLLALSAEGFADKLRLVGGFNASEGRLEIFYNGSWGTVCDDSVYEREASMFCRMMGLG